MARRDLDYDYDHEDDFDTDARDEFGVDEELEFDEDELSIGPGTGPGEDDNVEISMEVDPEGREIWYAEDPRIPGSSSIGHSAEEAVEGVEDRRQQYRDMLRQSRDGPIEEEEVDEIPEPEHRSHGPPPPVGQRYLHCRFKRPLTVEDGESLELRIGISFHLP